MDKFTIVDGQIVAGNKPIGPASALHVDPGELKALGKADGVMHKLLPKRIDLLFGVDARVAGGEMKRPHDLMTSTRNRRLMRQMRTLVELVDIPLLVLRGGFPFTFETDPLVWENLAKLQVLGVTILPVPTHAKRLVEQLGVYREMLHADSRTPLSALAGTDRPKRALDWTLLEAVRGVGQSKARAARQHFGSAWEVLKAVVEGGREEELTKVGITDRLRGKIKEGLK